MVGTWQLVLIFAIVLVLFGAGRIPKIMRDLGVGFRAFKKGIDGLDVDDKESCENSASSIKNKQSIQKQKPAKRTTKTVISKKK